MNSRFPVTETRNQEPDVFLLRIARWIRIRSMDRSTYTPTPTPLQVNCHKPKFDTHQIITPHWIEIQKNKTQGFLKSLVLILSIFCVVIYASRKACS